MEAETRRRQARDRMRKWRSKNPPRVLTAEQKVRALERCRAWRKRHPERTVGKYRPAVWKARPYTYSLSPRIASAKKRGIPFSLTNEDVAALWTGRCAITGLPFDTRKGVGKGPKPFSPSLDRIRPALGYVPGNVRFVLHCVNSFRGTMSDRLMTRVAERILTCDRLKGDRTLVDKA